MPSVSGRRSGQEPLMEPLKGRALGITEEGVLKIEDSGGTIQQIYSADIEVNV